ncbi:VOC family protein [Actinomadura logoneensis]|uniref:VOC family protein n=1 Tax=Actinomadura logoneensis TaxID=2293572 RepID=A0A372JEB9_9ACTN|nr:VOC family protein [Actinomadura logoneensis]RFU38312.1 VOC family protein [Actinomadura logoneensis]
MDWKLETIVVPVADVDRAKAFYSEGCGFAVDVDFSNGGDFRIVQLTPPGSACSITLMREEARAGAVQGLHIVVPDIDAARETLVKGGVDVSEPYFHGPDGSQTTGHHPERVDFGTYLSFQDPDGNGWLIQEVPSRRP